ncbi:MAG: tRNA (adenosine(37)-N6)-threonylcarbamoyltransferase complex transferase subunit TsaD [Candidatus Omnitrophica bacterium]|nr:tRNA (adenosine(37)-N6)-threonylcarbamoyltransferase complex transferase subunit TsaD [Candidatus Omnitrophota bacterium]
MIIVGIETSCDETGIGILTDNIILCNIIATQENIHSVYGGVVPELASRAHTERIDILFNKAIRESGIKISDIDYIGVTNTPGLKGSLLVGVSFAVGLAYSLRKPLYKVNHLYSHIASNFLNPEVKFPALGFVVSGGHTTFFYIKNPVSFNVVGRTLDDACGETFDKVARMLNLGFPGGPYIEKMAEKGDETKIKFPVTLLDKTSLDFSFSGLKTAVLYYIKKNGLKNIQDICASFQKAVGDTLIEKTSRCIERYRVKSLLLGGGVVQNGYIRKRFQELSDKRGINLFIPDRNLCLDNGAMVAIMTSFLIRHSVSPSENIIEVIPT